MPNSRTRISVLANADRSLVWERGDSIRYIAVQLEVPEVEARPDRERLPLNLAMVIDASGSMADERLESAKSAAKGIAESLTDEDTLSIVTFADDTQIHLDGVPMTSSGRHLAAACLAPLVTRGSTDLSGGWLKGAECAATVMERTAGLHSRVIVLSDGHANRGILDATEIGAHAEQLLARGLATSTVGIGDGYAPDFLRSLADSGGGTMHDAEHASEIVEVVLAELGDLRRLAAENLRVVLRCPESATASSLQPGEVRWSTVATTNFGAAIGNSKRVAVFRVRTGPGQAGGSIQFVVDVHWKVPGEEVEESVSVPLLLTWAAGVDNTPQHRDEGVTLLAGEAWHSVVVHHASRLNRLGQWSEAQKYLDDELRFFRQYAEGFDALKKFVLELEALRHEAKRDWGERSRKEVEMLAYRRSHGKPESRMMARSMNADALIGSRPSRVTAPSVEYPLIASGGHLFIQADGRRLLLDTGSPISIGSGQLNFAGKSTALQPEFAGADINALRAMVGAEFDILLGMDVLGAFRIGLDKTKGVARVGLPAPKGNRWRAIPLATTAGVPTVSVFIAGVARRAFIDLGAKISYVTGGIPGATTQAEDFYPGLGKFTTLVGEADVELAGERFAMQFGSLPKLLEMNLMVAGCDAILGAELLSNLNLHFDFPGGTLAVQARGVR